MAHGGKRKGAGRKVASHTLKAQEVRKLLIEEIGKEAKPLIKGLIVKGKAGDVKAIQELFNRSMGKVADNLKLDFKNPLAILLTQISNEEQPAIKKGERVGEEPTEQEVAIK